MSVAIPSEQKLVSSAAKHALREVLVWGAAARGIFGLIYYFDDLRTALGPGAESVSQSARQAPDRKARIKTRAGSAAPRG